MKNSLTMMRHLRKIASEKKNQTFSKRRGNGKEEKNSKEDEKKDFEEKEGGQEESKEGQEEEKEIVTLSELKARRY
jgi:hypothetical protein